MNEKWDYSMKFDFKGTQKDWNQSLISKINKLTEMNYAKIVVPRKFEEIFKSLNDYSEKTQKIYDFYDVEYVITKNNNIYINLVNKLEIKNFDIEN